MPRPAGITSAVDIYCLRLRASPNDGAAGSDQGSSGRHTLHKQWGSLIPCTIVHLLWSLPPNTTRTLTHLSPSLRHAVAPSWAHWSGPQGPGRGNSLFPYVTNDVTESEEKREASRRSVGSIWILLTAKFFPCVRHEAFLCRWHDNLPAKGTARPLCRSLSVRGFGTQLQTRATWGPILGQIERWARQQPWRGQLHQRDMRGSRVLCHSWNRNKLIFTNWREDQSHFNGSGGKIYE